MVPPTVLGTPGGVRFLAADPTGFLPRLPDLRRCLICDGCDVYLSSSALCLPFGSKASPATV